jgi:hypothetical protein
VRAGSQAWIRLDKYFTHKGEKAPGTLEALHWMGELVVRIGEAETVGTASLGDCVLHPIRRQTLWKVVWIFPFF